MLATAVGALLSLEAMAAPAAAATGTLGTVGLGRGLHGSGGAMLGLGQRPDGSGIAGNGLQTLLYAEGGVYIKASAVGNLAGLHGGILLGYDGVPTPAEEGTIGDTPFTADLWLAFPVTLLNLGDGANDWLRLSIAPSLGSSLVSSYLSLKSALAVQVPVIGETELAYTWWPDAASKAWGAKGDTFNAAALKLSVYPVLGSRRWHVFAQLRRGQRVKYQAPQVDFRSFDGMATVPGAPGAFATEQRSDWDTIGHLGLGVCF